MLTFWIAYVLTRPLGASLGDLLTQSKDFGGLDLGASTTSLLFFAVILALVAREQILANRHGVAVKGDGPIGGRRADFAWAAAGAVLIAAVGVGLSTLHPSPSSTDTVAGEPAPTPGAANGTAAPVAQQPKPTTRLGNLTAFATITADLQAEVAKNDLAGGKKRAKDLEVSWDDAEAGLKPRDSSKWHRLDDEIDAVLTSLRAGSPSRADCAANLVALKGTLDQFDGV